MPKVTVYLDRDEWYPVYIFSDKNDVHGTSRQVSSTKLAEWKRILKRFMQMQEEIKTTLLCQSH